MMLPIGMITAKITAKITIASIKLMIQTNTFERKSNIYSENFG